MPSRPPDDGARRRPVQARSAERVNRILEATAELIGEHGVDAVGTSDIARRAGITLASLYRYFPNKTAVVKALAERHFARLRVHLDRFLEDFDLDGGLDEVVDAYADFFRTEPGYVALWSGMHAIPELQVLDREDLHANARAIAARARDAFPEVDEDELFLVAMAVTRAIGALLRLAMTRERERADELLAEAKLMARSYLRARLGRPQK